MGRILFQMDTLECRDVPCAVFCVPIDPCDVATNQVLVAPPIPYDPEFLPSEVTSTVIVEPEPIGNGLQIDPTSGLIISVFPGDIGKP
jgi:hypothetical protein